ncbi:MAG: UDP-N-acetylmuramoyl-L-alanyl-D-glutamate--2,6-diaminopimelate ligase [Gammaproteobacteria bacterium]|nr:UDP-N-acetylmuramoyl-L-alanyl-D-glutamate--2,6-diaminopimelate ligase [Gammaproteobacteria bacterium]
MAVEQTPLVHRLSDLLAGFAAVDPARDRDVRGLANDSRRVRPGDLFLARAGQRTHGLDFLREALQAGAVAVAWEPLGAAPNGQRSWQPPAPDPRVPMFGIEGLGGKIGVIADRFYAHPSRALFVIGITGTDGKTSCSQFLAQALSGDLERCGVIGTLGYGLYGQLQAAAHTTPDALTLQSLLADMRDRGVRRVVMEVSSHSLEQERVSGVAFDVAVLTNLTRDHLDYHGDQAAYARAKRRLFETPGLHYAVINADDAFGRELLSALPAEVRAYGYSLDPAGGAQVRSADLRMTDTGFEMYVVTPWGEGRLRSGLLGRFNAGNLLAALSVLLIMDVPLPEALQRLGRTATVPGRMERFGGGPGRPLVVVDYAHTPEALSQVLQELRRHCTGELWCVFGCGGERDAGKRPLMGAGAERHADRVVVTDDNPRHEDPTQIVIDILLGMRDPDAAYIRRERGQAIAFAIEQARPGDVVLVAGKGHEEYQLIGDRTLSFSDRERVAELLDKVWP